MKPLVGRVGIAAATLLVVLWPALARAQEHCAPGQTPQLAARFQELVDRLGSRVGEPTDCEHTEPTTGDLQQDTSGGLLYLRQSTGTPTFTDGAEHWAVRGGQVLEWTGSEVDPPPSARIAATSVPTPPVPTPAPRGSVAAVPTSAPDIGGVLVVLSLGCVALVLLAMVGLAWARRRPAAPAWVVQPGTQLATATASVTALQSPIHDIGAGRITGQAADILRRDAEPMVWQERPFALAILLPTILKWALVLVVGLVLAVAFGQAAWLAVPAAVVALVLGRAYAALSGTAYRVSSQRLEIATGLASQRKRTWELYDLGDAVIVQPLHYRLFGVGNLTVQHRSEGRVTLEAIRNPELVRDLLRGSGQAEAARWDKIRLR